MHELHGKWESARGGTYVFILTEEAVLASRRRPRGSLRVAWLSKATER